MVVMEKRRDFGSKSMAPPPSPHGDLRLEGFFSASSAPSRRVGGFGGAQPRGIIRWIERTINAVMGTSNHLRPGFLFQHPWSRRAYTTSTPSDRIKRIVVLIAAFAVFSRPSRRLPVMARLAPRGRALRSNRARHMDRTPHHADNIDTNNGSGRNACAFSGAYRFRSTGQIVSIMGPSGGEIALTTLWLPRRFQSGGLSILGRALWLSVEDLSTSHNRHIGSFSSCTTCSPTSPRSKRTMRT